MTTVILSSARLESIRQRILNSTEPNFSAFNALKQAAGPELERRPDVPETWYVPGYYRDAEGHIRSKAALEGTPTRLTSWRCATH